LCTEPLLARVVFQYDAPTIKAALDPPIRKHVTIRGRRLRHVDLHWAAHDPRLERVRREPRFASLIALP